MAKEAKKGVEVVFVDSKFKIISNESRPTGIRKFVCAYSKSQKKYVVCLFLPGYKHINVARTFDKEKVVGAGFIRREGSLIDWRSVTMAKEGYMIKPPTKEMKSQIANAIKNYYSRER